MSAPFGSYVVRDRRGSNPDKEPEPVCRVCGSPEQHSTTYNTPTMECIKYLRAELKKRSC